MKPSPTLITLGALLSLQLLLALVAIMVHEQRVEAGLVDIYNRYRPRVSIEHALNSSASSLVSQLSAGGGSGLSRSIEYNSPIKRIMELISQHTPVIVVSSSANNNQDHPPPPPPPRPHLHPHHQPSHRVHHHGPIRNHASPSQHQQSASTLPAGHQMASSFHHQAPSFTLAGSNSDQQHWTIMETQSPMIQSALAAASGGGSETGEPQILAGSSLAGSSGLPFGEHQQYHIQQVSGPGEPLDYGNHLGLQMPSQQQQQLADFVSAEPGQAGGGQQFQQQQQHHHFATFSPSNSQLQPAAGPIYFQQPHYQDQQARQQPAQLQEEPKPQPIFLSSYVPEPIQVPASAGPTLDSPAVAPATDGPESIQDIQAEQAPSGSPDQADEATEPNKMAAGTHADESESDIEEPRSANQSGSGAQDESEEPGNTSDSGSITYEDKYDSDKDEPRSSEDHPAADGPIPHSSSSDNHNSNSGSESATKGAEQASAASTNGLISVGLNDDCLQCICRASSGCDHLLRCITRGSEEKYCGPFQLTEDYWNMAGSPGDASTNFSSFEDCANEADCAVETVTNYMKKYHKDCDGDNNITCMDYARLHRLKPDECGDTEKLTTGFDAYWAKFQRCAEGYNRSRTGDDEDI